jgi:hypothetical protein
MSLCISHTTYCVCRGANAHAVPTALHACTEDTTRAVCLVSPTLIYSPVRVVNVGAARAPLARRAHTSAHRGSLSAPPAIPPPSLPPLCVSRGARAPPPCCAACCLFDHTLTYISAPPSNFICAVTVHARSHVIVNLHPSTPPTHPPTHTHSCTRETSCHCYRRRKIPLTISK